MAAEAQFRCDVGGPDALAALREAPLPPRLQGGPATRTFHRDIFLDTPDRALSHRGVSCRVRITALDQRILTLFLGGPAGTAPERYEAAVPELDPRQALEGGSEPARRLRGLIDPGLLKPRIELEVERWSRVATSGFLFWRKPRFAFLYDACTVRHGGLTRTFEEIQVRRVAPGMPRLQSVALMLERRHGLRPLALPRHERAAQLAELMAAEAAARAFSGNAAVVLLALEEGRLGFVDHEGSHALPTAPGSGEPAVRHLLQASTGSGVGTLALVGSLPATEDRGPLEIWVARRIRADAAQPEGGLSWMPVADAIARIGTPLIRAPETVAALAVASRAGLVAPVPGTSGERPVPSGAARPLRPAPRRATPTEATRFTAKRAETDLPPDRFLNVELSQIGFQQRVLELAEDPGVPLAERLRFLAILSSNLDEFFAVRVGALKLAVQEGSTARSFDGLTPREQLEAISARVPPLLERQSAAARECLALAAARGAALRRWDELTDEQRAALVRHFHAELLPVLTPRAVTTSPGHPFPVIPQLVLTFAAVVIDAQTGPVHFASLPLRTRLDRLVPVPGSDDLITLEEVVRANIQEFYPDRQVESAWLFRITRGADLDVNEEEAGDLLQAIEEEVRRRPGNMAVRVEVESGMPALVRDMLVRELRYERHGMTTPFGLEDVYEVDPPLDLSLLRDLAGRLPASESYPPFQPRRPFPEGRPLFDLIDAGDLLVHHPYEDFSSTVGRFLEEAAADPEVVAIKMTLYRVGDRSPIVDALEKAARAGKDVAVFVELKARFDEARNVSGVRRLEDAGAQVIYGLVGLKNHAKVALVMRKTPDGLKRYAHVGTGNYNAGTARFYTDLGLLTADPEITADLTDLFNQLTGSSGAPASTFRRLLVAPATMLPGFLERIDREIAHQAAGRPARIRAQTNGLEDPEIVAALYRAAAAGVPVDLVVRTLCVLRPGVPGLSERIRVVSVLGRFLEHERIYHFGNGGEDEYLIGSADWRPRNLRRRVEVVAPVRSPALAARLDSLLTSLLAEPSAWTLGPDGTFARRQRPGPGHPHLHERLIQ